METGKIKKSNISFILGLTLLTILSCDREILDSTPTATFSNNPEVFIDGFSAGLEYLPFAGSYFEAFSVDTETKYDGTAAMRFDVPNVGNPSGAYAGAIFPDYGGRDLSGYDALTFWAKASQTGTINEIGFGQDFGENKYQAVLSNLTLSTNWNKYTIAIPDPSKLTRENGMFWYAEGPENGVGYSFWIDELKFEKLGTIAQPRPAILNGDDATVQTFIGSNTVLTGLTQTYNLETGLDQTVTAAPGYFTFTSSNPSVATVDENGIVSIIGAGTAVIKGSLGGLEAAGSLTLESLGEFTPAPSPARDPGNVISIFSDAYVNYPVDFYNGYFAPFQTTLGQDDIEIDGDNIIKYTELNFVATEFQNPTLNASEMTNFHVDIQVEEEIQPGDFIRIQLGDFGPNGAFGGGDDSDGSVTFQFTTFSTGEWVSLDIPLGDFELSSTNNLAQIFFVSDATISTILVDNMYFYKLPSSPTEAAPTPTLPEANVISLFSDEYTDVPVDTWRTEWSAAATVFEDLTIEGNATKKYTNLGFVGIETVTNTIDASGMTHFHLDVWSPDFTTFNIKLVDFGPDNAFDGGDDTEHEISITSPAQGEWISLDIPLSDFTGLTSTSNIAQYIFVGLPFEVTDVFIDNMYFHN